MRLCTLLIGVLASCLVSSAHSAPRSLWKINADGTGLARFAGEPAYRCGSPQWSPDGKFVAFDTWPAGKSNLTKIIQIAVVRADGSDLRLIGHEAMPSWSPDSKQIACHTNESPQTIVVMNADGSGRETIANHWGNPRWLRKSNQIATILDGTIAVYDPTTGRENVVLPSQFAPNYGFSVSYDGRQFCFGGYQGGLFLGTLSAGKPMAVVRQLVQSGSYHHSSFSPDGQKIVFSRPLPKVDNSLLHFVKVNGKSEPVLLSGQDETKYNCDPTWSPDGKTIIFASESPDP